MTRVSFGRALICGALLCLGALVLLGAWEARERARFTPLEALADPAGWETIDNFHASPSPHDPLDAPTPVRSFSGLRVWRSYSPQTGMVWGSITSMPFAAPDYLAVPYVGFPGESPDTRVVLRCAANGAERVVSNSRTNTQWAIAYIDMRGFCPAPVRLIATNASSSTFVGVATPFALNRSAWAAHSRLGSRLVAGFAAWAIIVLLGYACIAVLRRWTPALEPLPAAAIGLGFLAMLQFVLFTIDPAWGRVGVWAMMLGALLLALAMAWRRPARLREDIRAAASPLLMWLGVALAGVSLIAAADSGGGSWAVNALFTPTRWSTDNQLPMQFTEALLSRTPREDIRFALPWLVTDRGPLMTAMLAFPRVMLAELGRHWGSSFQVQVYSAASILLQSGWVLLVPYLGTMLGLRRPGWMLAGLAATPFLIFNTLYAWPKLLGAFYVVLCVVLLFGPGARARIGRPAVLPAVAVAAGLSYLAHASNAFALVPIAAIALPVIWQAGPWPILTGVLGLLAVMAPWLWWQAFIQPGATSLLRFALANDFGLQRRGDPIWPDIKAYYHSLGVKGWVLAKLEAARMMLGLPRDWLAMPEVGRLAQRQPPLGELRIADFFSLARGLNAALLMLPLVLLVRAWRVRTALTRLAGTFLALGAAGIAFTVLVTVAPAWLHHLPYGSVLLILLGLLLLAETLPASLAWIVPAAGIAYAACVWLGPAIMWADRVNWDGILGLLAGAMLAAGACLVRRPGR